MKTILIVLHFEEEGIYSVQNHKDSSLLAGVTFIIKSLLCSEQWTLFRHMLGTSAAFTLEFFFCLTKQE